MGSVNWLDDNQLSANLMAGNDFENEFTQNQLEGHFVDWRKWGQG